MSLREGYSVGALPSCLASRSSLPILEGRFSRHRFGVHHLPLRQGASTLGNGALGKGEKTTYGRSPKKPTVGFEDDPRYVASATYRRFYFGGFEGELERGQERCLPRGRSDSDLFPYFCR